jgi:hypothetical protein
MNRILLVAQQLKSFAEQLLAPLELRQSYYLSKSDQGLIVVSIYCSTVQCKYSIYRVVKKSSIDDTPTWFRRKIEEF